MQQSVSRDSSRSAITDEVDEFIIDRMRDRDIVGVSIAIINDGVIVKARGYGFTNRSGASPVTADTLFQAGSISKPVAAMGALRLVQDGVLQLDEDVNTQLRSWKVPENEFTRDRKVTLRGILSHTAGLTVHGFPGYSIDDAVPTLVQVLDGAAPANTEPIRVDILPGSQCRYSGGGYTIAQLLMEDVTAKPFAKFMCDTVLTPLGMISSTYEQPLPRAISGSAATGHVFNGDAVKGGWHIYPEMAAAGLWATPSDLARFAIGVQQSLAGLANPVISQSTTQLMLTEQQDRIALGVYLQGNNETLRFFHGGRDEGFDALLTAHAHTGQGAAIMLNANEDAGTLNEIAKAIEKCYCWN
jgi:CubicO group peptidase (beta-lactamase class C family)